MSTRPGGGAGPAAHRACVSGPAPLARLRGEGLGGRGGRLCGERARRTPGGCYGYRQGGSGEVSGANVRSQGRVAAPRRVAARGPVASAPGGGFRDLPGAGRRPNPARRQPHLLTWAWVGATAVFPFGRGLLIRGADGARGQAVPEGGPGSEPRGRGLSPGCSLSIRRPARALRGRRASATPLHAPPSAIPDAHRDTRAGRQTATE